MRIVFVVLMLLASRTLTAQEKPDLQLRFPTHIQSLSENGCELNIWGIGTWAVLPNVLAQGNNMATLLVSGLLWQPDKANWFELMGGGRVNQDGYIDPILNIRFLVSVIPKVALLGEIQQSFRGERRRFLWWLAADTTTPLWKVRAGVEMENINFWGKKDSYGLGPRVTIPIPIKLPSGGKLAVAVTYQLRNDRDFVRMYTVTTFKF